LFTGKTWSRDDALNTSRDDALNTSRDDALNTSRDDALNTSRDDAAATHPALRVPRRCDSAADRAHPGADQRASPGIAGERADRGPGPGAHQPAGHGAPAGGLATAGQQ